MEYFHTIIKLLVKMFINLQMAPTHVHVYGDIDIGLDKGLNGHGKKKNWLVDTPCIKLNMGKTHMGLIKKGV
jgi:hypothetical protein